MATYIVLNDGDTFSPLRGCKIVTIDETALDPDSTESLDNGNMSDVIGDGPKDGVVVHDLFTILEKWGK